MSRIKKTQGRDVDQITCDDEHDGDDEDDDDDHVGDDEDNHDNDLDDGLVVHRASPSDEGPLVGRVVQSVRSSLFTEFSPSPQHIYHIYKINFTCLL